MSYKLVKSLSSTAYGAKKGSITTTQEQYVTVTSQLLATGSCIDDVTIGQHFESFGAVMG